MSRAIRNQIFNLAEGASVSGGAGVDLLLSGFILNDGDSAIISRGFNYGPSSDNLNDTIESVDSTNTFTAQINAPLPVYYQAYAENTTGIGLGDIRQLVLP